MKDDYAARIGRNYERVNSEHMPPKSSYEGVLQGLVRFLIALIAVLLVALVLAQIAGGV